MLWLAMCPAALIHALRNYQGTSDGEMEEWLAFQMMALSFPSSLIVAAGLFLTGAVA